MKRKTRIGAVLSMRCPKCFQGSIFVHQNPYRMKTISAMPKHCPNCDQRFEPEPGFFFGAAYVSYALTVALWVTVGVALASFDAWGWIEFSFFENVSFFLMTGICVLMALLPVVWRLSRAIWMHLMIKKG